ncbi:MAG TPA: periplasmic heavy metal sensor [Pseudolabrys sp.]|jgi:uncharacterized membrane protein|nr:periplasmic heavy metal sensor [Pseudolabrys sp.]
MSVAQAIFTSDRNGSRWLLLGSLALNLFFIGVAIAMAIRAPAPSTWDPDVFVRVERLAATLPPPDATILRGEMAAHHDDIARVQDAYGDARSDIRVALRQKPFSAEGLRAAMAKTQDERQAYYELIHNVFADAAAKMSPAGRLALANSPHGRKHSHKR